MLHTIKITLFLVFAAVALFAACTSQPAPASQFEERVGKEAVETIQQAETALLIIQDTESSLSEDQVNSIKKLLLADEGYLFDRTKKCLFIPQATLSFDQGKTKVIVSMSCKQLKIVSGGKSSILDTDPMADALHQLITKEL